MSLVIEASTRASIRAVTGAVLRAGAVLVLLGAGGCVYASKVTGPNGQEAFRIHCAGRPQCLDKAAEVCAGDYEVLTSKTEVDGFVNNGTGTVEAPHEIIIACHSAASGGSAVPAPSGVRVSPPAPAAVPGPPLTATATATEPSSLCPAAHASVKETAAYWAHLYPEAKLLPEPPSERDFVEVCRALPERVQRCLDARHREAHEKSCFAVLRRLEPQEKNKVDSLFLE